MSVTDFVILLFVVLLLLYAIYDEFLMNRIKGKTLLRVHLRRRNMLDSLIFLGLIAIVIYNSVTSGGSLITLYLLLSLALITCYIAFIRWPKLLFKPTGFFYANVFIDYNRIKGMNLSEDGILVIDLEQRRLLIQVVQLDDLERIYNFFLEQK